jgi:NTP pyrophosphatase (non-canonical NTP hydrolase)
VETQQTIVLWAEANFHSTPASVATRMVVEMAELLQSLDLNVVSLGQSCLSRGDSKESIVEECADVGVMLAQVAFYLGVNMKELVWEGACCSNIKLALNLNKELADLAHGMVTLPSGTSDPKLKHHAEVATGYLWDLTWYLSGEDLWPHIEAKMTKNRARTWALVSPGVFQHFNKE